MKLMVAFKLLSDDWLRIAGIPGASFIYCVKTIFPNILIRLNWALGNKLGLMFKILLLIIYRVEYSPRCFISGGLILYHPFNVIIGAHSIGRNCTIYTGALLGATSADLFFDRSLRPVIGNNTTIGARCVILGGHFDDGVKLHAGKVYWNGKIGGV